MRDRLIELLKEIYPKTRYIPMEECREKLANHLLENGVIVPHCKVGQTVYAVDKRSCLWWQGEVISLCYTANIIEYGVLFKDGEFAVYNQDAVFHTKEEAVKALKGSAE